MNVPVSMVASTDGILGNGYEEVKEITSSWSQNLVNTRSPSYLKQKIFKCCF